MRDLPDTFSLPQRLLHWTMVGLILLNLLFPQKMWYLFIPGFEQPISVHIVIGLAVLLLAVLRLFLRLGFGVPPEPLGAPWFFRVFARTGQWIFYLFFFAMPLTGLLAHYGHLPFALTLHTRVIQPLFWVLIPIHVSLALAHQYLWKTDMLGKILRG
ncbi:MAG: cytochrome b [Rhodobacteraceae bacterium]|nr:MAG: cytochrome b [Paracoccaceae bacterium]